MRISPTRNANISRDGLFRGSLTGAAPKIGLSFPSVKVIRFMARDDWTRDFQCVRSPREIGDFCIPDHCRASFIERKPSSSFASAQIGIADTPFVLDPYLSFIMGFLRLTASQRLLICSLVYIENNPARGCPAVKLLLWSFGTANRALSVAHVSIKPQTIEYTSQYLDSSDQSDVANFM